MLVRLFIVIVLGLILAACGSDSVTATPMPTPSPFWIPASTALPTPTLMPRALVAMPEWNEWDVTVVAGQYVFQVTRAYSNEQIGTSRAKTGHTYLLLEGRIYNFGNNNQAIFDTDFRLQIPNNPAIYEPIIEQMQRARRNGLVDSTMDFPGENILTREQFVVGRQTWRRIYLVYEIPAPVQSVQLRFGPASISPRSVIEIWFFQDEDNLRFFKAYDNGEELFEVDFDFTNPHQELGELIDTRIFEEDNCFGTEEIEHSVSVSQRLRVSYNFGGEIELAARGLAHVFSSNLSFMGIVSGRFEAHFDITRDEEVLFSELYTLSAAPRTKARYQIAWYRVNLHGLMHMRLGGESFYMPYTLTNLLRSELESLPQGTC